MAAVEDKREFIYRVDAHDRIVFANAEWYNFAGENAAMTIKPAAVIGFLLWDFICHPTLSRPAQESPRDRKAGDVSLSLR